VTVAAGEVGGFYVEFSELLVRRLRAGGIDARFVETDGSVENLRRVADGTAALALALTDVVLAARNSDPPFDTPLDLRVGARHVDLACENLPIAPIRRVSAPAPARRRSGPARR
jgi:hypothetical protein